MLNKKKKQPSKQKNCLKIGIFLGIPVILMIAILVILPLFFLVTNHMNTRYVTTVLEDLESNPVWQADLTFDDVETLLSNPPYRRLKCSTESISMGYIDTRIVCESPVYVYRWDDNLIESYLFNHVYEVVEFYFTEGDLHRIEQHRLYIYG